MLLGTCWFPSVDPQLMARCPITDGVLGVPHNAARATAASAPGAWSAFFCHEKYIPSKEHLRFHSRGSDI